MAVIILFLMVVLSRILLPVDIMSYVIGLFTHIDFFSYTAATLIGIIPFAYVFAYGATLPILVQLLGGFMLFIVFFYSYGNIKKQFKH